MVVVVWRCKCRTRIKVLGEADLAQTSTTQLVSCPKCGDSQTVSADKIISVTADTSDLFHSDEPEHEPEI